MASVTSAEKSYKVSKYQVIKMRLGMLLQFWVLQCFLVASNSGELGNVLRNYWQYSMCHEINISAHLTGYDLVEAILKSH